jgi:hypothetical protein
MGTNYRMRGVVPPDSIDDTEIDWGTGTNQVSQDDVSDGSTYARVKASSLTSNEVTKVTDSAGDDLTVSLASANRVLTVSGNATLNQDVSSTGTPTFSSVSW